MRQPEWDSIGMGYITRIGLDGILLGNQAFLDLDVDSAGVVTRE